MMCIMLSKTQYNILYFIFCCNGIESIQQRELAQQLCISLKDIKRCCKKLKKEKLVDEKMQLTLTGIQALAPYQVKNAIIMAAGMSSRFAPFCYDKPKCLLMVKGEVLIERQIRQLQEAGIDDITVVVGHMKEKMFYLAEKMGVKIVINEDYYRYNNTSSLIRVADKLGNTYICSSDNYFSENVFTPYVYHSYYAAVFEHGETDEYCLKCNSKGRIIQVNIGGRASWYMLGHVYFSQEFSHKFIDILKMEYALPVTKVQLWEDMYIRHLNVLHLYIKTYDRDKIHEFDTLEDLRRFDPSYITNVDSIIFKNITNLLQCNNSEIQDIHPIKTGLTKTAFIFSCRDKKYVYRHTNTEINEYINPQNEAFLMRYAKMLELDNTFIYMDPLKGWKISHYIQDVQSLNYHNHSQVDTALYMIRKLHNANIDSKYSFNIWDIIEKMEGEIQKQVRDKFHDYDSLYYDAEKLFELIEHDKVAKCLCHCNFCNTNILIDQNNKFYLINWEYAGNSDPACDIGMFIACSNYSLDEAKNIIYRYLLHEPSNSELRHYLAYVSIISYYLFLRAILQESIGNQVGELLYIWYKYIKLYGTQARTLYETEIDNDEN